MCLVVGCWVLEECIASSIGWGVLVCSCRLGRRFFVCCRSSEVVAEFFEESEYVGFLEVAFEGFAIMDGEACVS